MTTLQKVAGLFGAVFLLVGVLGFVPGITSRFGEIGFAGHESTAELLGLFQVSVLHNVVHLLFGVVGLLAARRGPLLSRQFLIGGGVVYLALTAYGFVVNLATSANFVPVNTADNFLHLALGVAMVGAGLGLSRDARTA
ncbi:MAG TPA: DUF4383 domain-containing protein [Acidimicrobiales bacterium]|nr:DUF4383 domain-containing protein [Acidimicrobiales bacterium]